MSFLLNPAMEGVQRPDQIALRDEEDRVKTNDENNLFWLQNKYIGLKFLDEDEDPPEYRVIFRVDWSRQCRSGAKYKRREKGYYLLTRLDEKYHNTDDDEVLLKSIAFRKPSGR